MKIWSLLDKIWSFVGSTNEHTNWCKKNVVDSIVETFDKSQSDANKRAQRRLKNKLPETISTNEDKEVIIFDNLVANHTLKLVRKWIKSELILNIPDPTNTEKTTTLTVQVSNFNDTIKLFELFFWIEIWWYDTHGPTTSEKLSEILKLDTELEVKFLDIDINSLMTTLEKLWAELIKPHTMMKRVVYYRDWIKWMSLRIRDEGEEITMTLKKIIDETKIDGVKEVNIVISSFEDMILMFWILWILYKNYRQTARELWKYDDVKISIDEWPWLTPFVEIEWNSEEKVRKVANILWFDYSKWVFGVVSNVYRMKRWIHPDQLRDIDVITFDEHPWKD